MTTSSTPLACAQLREADSANATSIPSTLQPVAPLRVHTTATADPNKPLRFALLCAGILLSCVSVALAAQAGWHRGATQLESITWATAGVALAIVSLAGLSMALASHGTARRAAFTAWLLSLGFVIVAGLGSQHGGRELASRTDTAATGDRARVEATYLRASAELSALPAARPVGTIEQELGVLLQDSRLKNCDGWLENRRLRTVCIERISPLRAELETARARAKAQQDMDTATATLAAAKPTTPANSDATAVARYLAAIGIVLPVERLADLISLLTVAAIEIVGAVAIALGRQRLVAEPQAVAVNVQGRPRDGGILVPTAPVNAPLLPRVQLPATRAVNTETSDTIERLKARILGDLEHGPRACSQRMLAGELGVSVGYVNKALKELASGGRVNVSASREGTKLKLANA